MIPHTSTRAVLLLALLAAASGWLAWVFRDRDEPPPLVGPPRSDYAVETFELIAFNEQGGEAFSLTGPRLTRHPYLGTLDVEQPRMRMPAETGDGWAARANRALISRDADEITLRGDVAVQGPVEPGDQALLLTTSTLILLPDENRAHSDAQVTITGPGSILRGRGLRADLNTKRVELLAEVTARYEPANR